MTTAPTDLDTPVAASAPSPVAVAPVPRDGDLIPPGGELPRVDPQMAAALSDSIARLEEVVDEETAALASRRALDLVEFNKRKSMSLLELTRISRALTGKMLGAELGGRLNRVSDKLQRNQELLRNHLLAAQEVARLISDALRQQESDGTYSSVPSRPGGPR